MGQGIPFGRVLFFVPVDALYHSPFQNRSVLQRAQTGVQRNEPLQSGFCIKGAALIHLNDLQAQYKQIEDEIAAAIKKVFDNGQFILGPELEAFEEEFAAYCEAGFAVGVGNGLDALKCAMVGTGIKEGDEVILPANTYIATALAVSSVGATIKLVDCEDQYFNLDASKIAEAVTSKTKAIIPVHLYGQTVDMDPLNETAKKHGLAVIEDAAHAHGARYKGCRSGSLGHLGCFSFYPTKNLGAYGDGGAVVSDDPDMIEKIRKYRNYGQTEKNVHEMIGENTRLDEIQAAILRVKLCYLDMWNRRRVKLARLYRSHLKGTGIHCPEQAPWARNIYHLFVISHPLRDRIAEALKSENITCAIHYPTPLYFQKPYSSLGYSKGDFPVTESWAKSVLSLPMHPFLKESHVEHICDAIKRAF